MEEIDLIVIDRASSRQGSNAKQLFTPLRTLPPPPLWGRERVGGRADLSVREQNDVINSKFGATPLLNRPPQGGRKSPACAEAFFIRLRRRPRAVWIVRAGACLLFLLAAPCAALADKISNPTAVFEGLDKITGRTITFEVGIDETVQFGSLEVTPRVCYSRPPTEAPKTDVFAQVDAIDEKKQVKRIFSGWMFADSPGLNGVEHPIYDIWLTGCKGGTTVIREAPQYEAAASPDDNPLPSAAIDPNAGQPPPAALPKKRKPRPAVVAAPPDNNAPLDLGGGSPAIGNARSGR